MNNLSILNQLVSYFESQYSLFSKNTNDSHSYLYFLLDYPKTLAAKISYLNNRFADKLSGEILPIYHCNGDDYICIFQEKLYYINSESSYEENFLKSYRTPAELWNSIKADIESYYDQK